MTSTSLCLYYGLFCFSPALRAAILLPPWFHQLLLCLHPVLHMLPLVCSNNSLHLNLQPVHFIPDPPLTLRGFPCSSAMFFFPVFTFAYFNLVLHLSSIVSRHRTDTPVLFSLAFLQTHYLIISSLSCLMISMTEEWNQQWWMMEKKHNEAAVESH